MSGNILQASMSEKVSILANWMGDLIDHIMLDTGGKYLIQCSRFLDRVLTAECFGWLHGFSLLRDIVKSRCIKTLLFKTVFNGTWGVYIKAKADFTHSQERLGVCVAILLNDNSYSFILLLYSEFQSLGCGHVCGAPLVKDMAPRIYSL